MTAAVISNSRLACGWGALTSRSRPQCPTAAASRSRRQPTAARQRCRNQWHLISPVSVFVAVTAVFDGGDSRVRCMMSNAVNRTLPRDRQVCKAFCLQQQQARQPYTEFRLNLSRTAGPVPKRASNCCASTYVASVPTVLPERLLPVARRTRNLTPCGTRLDP